MKKRNKIIIGILISPIVVIVLYLIGGFFRFCPLEIGGSESPRAYIYSLEVIFEKDVDYQDAKGIINSYGLEFNKEYDYTGSDLKDKRDYINRSFTIARGEGEKEEDFNKLHRALVDIPKEKEQEWKQTLITDSKIEDAIIVPIRVKPSQSIFQKTITKIKIFLLFTCGVGVIVRNVIDFNETPQSIFFSYLAFFLIILFIVIWLRRKFKDKNKV